MNELNEVLAAAAKIVDDFGHHRTTDYFSGFSSDATFMFYAHTERLNSRAEYEKLWAKWENEEGFKVHGCRSSKQLVQLIGQESAVFTHLVSSDIEFAGEVSTVGERETIVFSKVSGTWLAVHEHLSPNNPS